jgi:ComF family protein
MGILASIVDTILPPRCVFTGEAVDAQGTISPKAWASLGFITAPYCRTCGFPFEIDAGGEALCGACLKEPPLFDKGRSALRYDDASRDFILGFKHGDRTHAAVSMVPWLKIAGAEFWDEADMIVPVPLHRWRLLRRRYNQAAIMALTLGRALNKKVMPDILLRTRATPSQGHLRAKEREENVKHAFVIHPKRTTIVTGKNIVLIDDVYTTGSTVTECTKALKEVGATKVFVLALARVVRPERF